MPEKMVHAALPYYEVSAHWEGGSKTLYAEAFLAPNTPPLLRAALVTPLGEGLGPAPPPGYVVLEPVSPRRLEESLAEAFREILEGRGLEEPPFEFEGLRGLVKAILSLGRYKPYRVTRGLAARNAYRYIRDVLEIPVVPELRAGRLFWKPIRVRASMTEEGWILDSIESLRGEEWRTDRVLMRLAEEAPSALRVMLEILWERSGRG